MLGDGGSQKEALRPDFNRSIMIDLRGAKISSDTGFLLLREMDERFGVIGPMEDCLEDRRSPVHARHSLVHMLRRFYVMGEGVRRSIEWLIMRLITAGARVSYHAKKWHVHVASAFPLVHYYRAVFGYG